MVRNACILNWRLAISFSGGVSEGRYWLVVSRFCWQPAMFGSHRGKDECVFINERGNLIKHFSRQNNELKCSPWDARVELHLKDPDNELIFSLERKSESSFKNVKAIFSFLLMTFFPLYPLLFSLVPTTVEGNVSKVQEHFVLLQASHVTLM